MKAWMSAVVPALLALGSMWPRFAHADAPAAATAPAAAAAPAPTTASTPAPPPGTYRNFPLSPAEAASIPQPDKDTFTLHARVDVALAQANETLGRVGPTGRLEVAEQLRRAIEAPVHEMASSAYRLGWREASHTLLPGGGSRRVFWMVSGDKLHQVVVTLQSGSVSFQPTLTVSPGWGDLTYDFKDLAAPSMAGPDFPLCVRPNGKPQHSGSTWSQTCAPDDVSVPWLQVPRLMGWHIVKAEAGKQKPILFQKGDRFAEATVTATQVKVTLLSGTKQKALLATNPAVSEGVRVHSLTEPALVFGGVPMTGPYRLELKVGQITATSKAGTSGTLWKGTAGGISADVVFDRMSMAGYWPTMRLVAADGRVFDIRTKDGAPALVAQVSKIVADPKADEQTKVQKLTKLSGGWSNVPDNALLEVVKNWKAK